MESSDRSSNLIQVDPLFSPFVPERSSADDNLIEHFHSVAIESRSTLKLLEVTIV